MIRLFALLLIFVAAPAFAATDGAARAKDAADIFNGACMRALGEAAAVDAVLQPLMKDKAAVTLPDVKTLGDARANAGYAIATPAGAKLTLLTGPKRYCSVLVDAADGAALRKAVQADVQKVAAGMQGKLWTDKVQTKEEAGTRVTLERYKVILNTKGKAAPTVTVSTADKSVNNKQHWLRFYIGNKPKD